MCAPHITAAALTGLAERFRGVLFLLFPASCGRSSDAQNRIALLDLRQPQDLLTEHGVLEPPPTLNATRFVSRWWPWNAENGTWLASARENARPQVVSVANSARTLHLNRELPQPGGDGRNEITIAGAILGKGIFLAQSGSLENLRGRRVGRCKGAGRSRGGEHVLDLRDEMIEIDAIDRKQVQAPGHLD